MATGVPQAGAPLTGEGRVRPRHATVRGRQVPRGGAGAGACPGVRPRPQGAGHPHRRPGAAARRRLRPRRAGSQFPGRLDGRRRGPRRCTRETLWSTGHFEEANARYTTALTLDSGHPAALHGIARVLDARGKTADAPRRRRARHRARPGGRRVPPHPRLPPRAPRQLRRRRRRTASATCATCPRRASRTRSSSPGRASSSCGTSTTARRCSWATTSAPRCTSSRSARSARSCSSRRGSTGASTVDLVLDTGAEMTVLSEDAAQRAQVYSVAETLERGGGRRRLASAQARAHQQARDRHAQGRARAGDDQGSAAQEVADGRHRRLLAARGRPLDARRLREEAGDRGAHAAQGRPARRPWKRRSGCTASPPCAAASTATVPPRSWSTPAVRPSPSAARPPSGSSSSGASAASRCASTDRRAGTATRSCCQASTSRSTTSAWRRRHWWCSTCAPRACSSATNSAASSATSSSASTASRLDIDEGLMRLDD